MFFSENTTAYLHSCHVISALYWLITNPKYYCNWFYLKPKVASLRSKQQIWGLKIYMTYWTAEAEMRFWTFWDLFSLKKKRLRGNVIVVFRYPMKDCSEDRDRPFLVLHSERKRGNRHKLPQGKSQIGIRKIYHHDGAKTVEQVAQKSWGVSIPGGLQDWRRSWAAGPLGGGLAQMTWKSPFQPALLFSDSRKQSSYNCFLLRNMVLILQLQNSVPFSKYGGRKYVAPLIHR